LLLLVDFWFGSGEYIFNPLDLDGDDANDTIQSRIKMLGSANETENGWRNVVDGRVAHWCTQRGILVGLPYGTSV
jgi:hypothetical protein